MEFYIIARTAEEPFPMRLVYSKRDERAECHKLSRDYSIVLFYSNQWKGGDREIGNDSIVTFTLGLGIEFQT